MRTNRDDFSPTIIDVLAKRACFHCSNPNCRIATLAPSGVDPEKFIYSGIAAHITAAAPGGPRFDAALSTSDRAGITNGIHLCGTCSIKIDKNNGLDYPAPMLREWKEQHDEWVRNLSAPNVEGLEGVFKDTFTRQAGRDILTLIRETRANLEILSRYAEIRSGKTVVRIVRPCVTVLLAAIRSNSLVVVGQPGAGKSGATYEVVANLMEDETDVVILNAGGLDASSRGMLREELNLSLPVHEILAHWQSDRPGVLVIDGLDGARTHSAAETLRDLIQLVPGGTSRWNILVSVRTFDLRHSLQLQRLFRGQPIEDFYNPEFLQIRHISIPLLTADELSQVPAQSEELGELIRQAPVALQELLQVPFNLRLAGELLGDGVNVTSLTPVRTQVDLLERFWQARVIQEDGQGDGREVVIRRAVEGMLQSGSLQADRRVAIADDSRASETLQAVLSTHVLIERQRPETDKPDSSVLAFEHHVLFDYAASRLILRGLPESCIARIVDKPDLVVALRPSFVLHFQYLWELSPNRAEFWNWVLRMAGSEGVPVVGKLIGLTVAGESAQRLSDLEFLVEQLEAGYPAAEPVVHYLRGAVLSRDQPLSGNWATPWCEFVERCTRSLKPGVVGTLCPLLLSICDHATTLSTGQRDVVGLTARRYLEYAWSLSPMNTWLANHAIGAICRTFDSDPVASEILLRRMLAPDHLRKWGYQELPKLTAEIEQIMPVAPDLVEDIYCAAYGHDEESLEQTPMGALVLSLTSNRRQDYGMALYRLGEAYPQFLRTAPKQASRALMRIVENTFAKQEAERHYEPREEQFTIGDIPASLRSDFRFVSYEHAFLSEDDYTKLLEAFASYLRELRERPEGPQEWHQVLQIILTSNRRAVLWKLVVEAAASAPQTLGQELKSILWTIPIFTCGETAEVAAAFLKVMFPYLSANERVRVEEMILSIPEMLQENERTYGVRLRDRLLRDLAGFEMVLEETRTLRTEAIHELERLRIDSSDLFADAESFPQNTMMSAENEQLSALMQALQGLATVNARPSSAEVATGLLQIKELYALLTCAPSSGIPQEEYDLAWGYLASACTTVIQALPADEDTSALELLREALLSASIHSNPVATTDQNEQFSQSAYWGWPSVRVDTVKGLMMIALRDGYADGRVLHAIERLGHDDAASVRYQVAGNVPLLYRSFPELMWRLLESLIIGETNQNVAIAAVNSLAQMASERRERSIGLLEAIHAQFVDSDQAEGIRKQCAGVFLALYLRYNDTSTEEIVRLLASDVEKHHYEAVKIVQSLRPLLASGPTNSPEPADELRRHRAIDLIHMVLHSAGNAMDTLTHKYTNLPFGDWPKELQTSIKHLHEVVFWTGMEVYFASGAFDERQGQVTPNQAPMDLDRKRRFLAELSPTIKDLAKLGNPRVAYHMIEMFDQYLNVAPREVFLLLDCTVGGAAQAVGLQYDSMAAEAAVKLVSRCFAEHRQMLRQDVECRQALLRILDTFVLVGWPSAVRMAHRLGDIYR